MSASLDIDYWDLPSVCQHDEDRANAAGIDLRQHISGADEPHDVTRTLDRLLSELSFTPEAT